MICLYNKNASSFEDNGVCVLDPYVCTVSEEAGGSYELYLEHPYDKHGKYEMIAENMIVKAPIPLTVIPEITLPETTIYTVGTASAFYKKLPVSKYTKKEKSDLDAIRSNPSAYTWKQFKGYYPGAYCTKGHQIYKCIQACVGIEPPNADFWEAVASTSSSSDTGTYTPGKEYNPGLSVGAYVQKIANYNNVYVQIKDSDGRIGYYAIDDLTVNTTESEVIPEQTITNQLFRIYCIESDEETHVIKAYARHISYDMAGNMLLECKVTDTKATDAIAVMQGMMIAEDDRRIACEFDTETITKDWSYKNPINALLDPDDGLVPTLNAKLIRNNKDFFILKNDNPRSGITIEYGVNLCGVTWNRNTENVVTRVVPRCNLKAGGFLYLEHGGTWNSSGTWVQNDDIYVDSQIASSFPFPRIEVLDAGFSVGDKYTPAGSTTETTRTEANCREEMLKLAKERFTNDHCDGVEISLDVEFCLLGDTEQYKQYRNLQRVNIYDQLKIKTEAYECTAQVTKYEYDCLSGRYNSIKVGDVSTFNKRVPGYRVVNESITYSKLSPDLISRIKTMNSPSGDSTGSSGSSTPDSGYDVAANIPANSKDDDGIVTKGSGQAGKVWKTDANGNPAWRDDASVTVQDNLTSTSATDALSANQGRVLNEKIGSLLYVEDVSCPSVTANAGATVYPNVSVAKTGYTPIGVVGYDVGGSWLTVHALFITAQNKVAFTIKNNNSISVTFVAKAYILYAKN